MRTPPEEPRSISQESFRWSRAAAASAGAASHRSCRSAVTSSGCSQTRWRSRDQTSPAPQGCPTSGTRGRGTSRSDTWQPLTLLTRVLGGNAVPSWPPGLPTQAVFHVFFAPANHSIARASHTALRREHGHHSPNGEIKHYLPVYSSWRQRQNYHEKEYTKVRECI